MPSAGFWKGQSNEVDLGMSYEQLDALLSFIEFDSFDRQSLSRILKEMKLTPEQYEFIRSKMNAAKHKQKMPKCLKSSSDYFFILPYSFSFFYFVFIFLISFLFF
jgi:NAD synthase